MLTKKLIKIFAISLGLVVSLASYADVASANFMNPSAYYYAPTLPQPAFVNTSSNGFFITLGGSYTYMKLPDFTYGNKLDINHLPTPSPAFRFHNRISTIMPSVAVGKYFYNNRFLPFLFGQTIGVKLEGSYWNDKSSHNINSADNAYFTPIDGSNQQDSINSNPDYQLQGIQFSAKNRFWHGGVFLTGYAMMGRTALAQFAREFRLGFIYNNLKQDFDFNGLRVPLESANANNYPQSLIESTKTNFYGVQIGNTLEATFNSNVMAFIKGDIALVHAKTDFSGSQVITAAANSSPSRPTLNFQTSISNSTTKMTYIADLGGGLTFHASGFPVNLTLGGGVQFFGYVPRIVNPQSSSTALVQPTQPPAKVVGTTALNPYATLQLTLLL